MVFVVSLPVLLLDPDTGNGPRVEEALRAHEPGAAVLPAASLRAALDVLHGQPVACVVTELDLPDANAAETLRALRRSGVPVVVWSRGGDDERAADCIRSGASAYLRKAPEALPRLAATVRAAIGAAVVAATNEPIAPAIDGSPDGATGGCADADPIVATTGAMRRTLALVERAAGSAVPVILQGETGTGKELLARAVHDRGPRRHLPFLVQNCAAIPETLLESELFGHRRGAFTGAERDRPGLFVDAGRGTVFLDEIGDAPPAVQARLLRVLQEGEVKAVGADRPVPTPARIVAATNCSLEEAVAAGRFRRDLYFRLAVFPIAIPPLRHRVADVAVLAERFRLRAEAREQRRTGGWAPDTRPLLARYAWPGNVRELEHEVHRLVLTVEPGQRIQPHHLAPRIRAAAIAADEPLTRILDRVALATVHERLDRYGSKTATARSLGITREALYARLRRAARD